LRRWNKLDPLTFAAALCASLSQDVGKRGLALRSLHVDGKRRVRRETIVRRVKAIVEVSEVGLQAL
jgi:hypothetical protein